MRQYKVWVEIEVLDVNGEPIEGARKPLPDCIGVFNTLKEAERAQWFITRERGIDPENSDVRPRKKEGK